MDGNRLLNSLPRFLSVLGTRASGAPGGAVLCGGLEAENGLNSRYEEKSTVKDCDVRGS